MHLNGESPSPKALSLSSHMSASDRHEIKAISPLPVGADRSVLLGLPGVQAVDKSITVIAADTQEIAERLVMPTEAAP